MSYKWHIRFLNLCNHIAEWSKDPSTQVGAVIVNDDKRIVSVGYNGFPQGVEDGDLKRYERPVKYVFTEHAERNAIYNANRVGVSTLNCILYCNYLPCPDCTRGIIQSGIKEVYYSNLVTSNKHRAEDVEHSLSIFNEAGVIVEQINL